MPISRAPTRDDLAYHLTTLFPHVRAKGHLEIRFVDALPGCWWIVPTAVIGALIDDPGSQDHARALCSATEGQWARAARVGVGDREMRRAAQGLLVLAADRLSQDPASDLLAPHVHAFLERWTCRGRSPADDVPDLSENVDNGCALDTLEAVRTFARKGIAPSGRGRD